MKLAIGDRVRRRPVNWERDERDDFGRGLGVGVVVEPGEALPEGEVYVEWPRGWTVEPETQLERVQVGS